MSPSARLLLGFVISSLIGYAGYRKHALSISGVAGAMLVGTTIFGAGGWVWGMLLITFFALSSALSGYKKAVKQQLAEKFAKGSRRDLAQTLANGGCGALLALAACFHPQPVMLAAFVGALATVNADTWATEIGVLSRRPPRLVTTGRVVEPGTSGGVSLLGTLSTLAGGLSIGLAAALFLLLDKILGGPGYTLLGADTAQGTLVLLPVATLGGLVGSLCDSILGATLQTIYYSTRRAKETERKIDPDGIPNEHLRGWKWLNNDWVNFLSSAVGAGVSVLAWKALLA